MLRWSLYFFIIALIAGAMGFTGIAQGASTIAQIVPEVAELLDRELNRAPALRVDAFAEERNRARVVDPVAYSGKQPLVGTPKDVLVRALSLSRIHIFHLPRCDSFNRCNAPRRNAASALRSARKEPHDRVPPLRRRG